MGLKSRLIVLKDRFCLLMTKTYEHIECFCVNNLGKNSFLVSEVD